MNYKYKFLMLWLVVLYWPGVPLTPVMIKPVWLGHSGCLY